jgi:hypothetical protein
MAVAQFIVVFCFVVMIVVFTLALCAAVGGLAWSCFKDAITDWKQYQLKDRVITIQEYNELMDSLQEVKDSMWVLCDLLRAKGLLD